MAINSTNFNGALRELDHDPEVLNLMYQDRPTFALIPKKEDAGGEFIPQPVIYGSSQGRSADFTRAQTNAASGGAKVVKFRLTHVENYQLIQWDNLVLEQSKNDAGAFISARKSELDAARENLCNDYSFDLFGSGTGARGTVGSFAGATITLANINDIVKYEPEMELVVAASDTSGLTRAGSVTVLSVNRDTGVITCTGTVTAGIAAIANNDFIYQRGDRAESGSFAREKISGFEAWLPATAPTGGDSFFAVDRSADAVRLAGCRLNAVGYPIEEAILEGARKVRQLTGKIDHAVMNPITFNDLVKSLGSRVRYCELKPDNVSFGFEGIMIKGQGGDIKCISDPTCPSNRIFGLRLSTWKLYSIGRIPRLLPVSMGTEDGQVTRPSADGIEVRLGGYAQLGCSAPGHNINIQI